MLKKFKLNETILGFSFYFLLLIFLACLIFFFAFKVKFKMEIVYKIF